MQEYFIPGFLVLVTALFLLLLISLKRKQTKFDEVRSRYYSRHPMQAPGTVEQAASPHGFQVLYERRAGNDRRVHMDRREKLRPGADRRQGHGRRQEDTLWNNEASAPIKN